MSANNTGSVFSAGTRVSLVLLHRPQNAVRGAVAYADTLGIAVHDDDLTFYPWSAVLSVRTEGK